MRCTNPNCRCHAEPPQLHGPYPQLTFKRNAKTVTKRLTKDEAATYGEFIGNRQRLQAVLGRMYDISRRALEAELQSDR